MCRFVFYMGDVSSEPLTDDPRWQPVPRNHIALIDRGLNVELRPIPG